METKFKIDLEDYLAYQLYSASTNQRIKSQRKRAVIILVIVLICTGIHHFFRDDNFFAIYFFATTAILSALLFPLFLKWYYKNYYLRHCKDVYKNNFGEEVTLAINEDLIQTKDRSGESSINISELTEIGETGQHYFLKLLSGQTVIVPKNKLNNLDEFKITLDSIAKKQNIEQKINLNWKWK